MADRAGGGRPTDGGAGRVARVRVRRSGGTGAAQGRDRAPLLVPDRGVGLVIEILYCAWNRLEFTRATFELLRRNTDWKRISRLVVYDDGSRDGTAEFLDEAITAVPVDYRELR